MDAGQQVADDIVLALGAVGIARWTGPVRQGVGPAIYGLLVTVVLAGLLTANADRFVGRIVPQRWADSPLWTHITRLASIVRQLRLRWPAVAVAVVASFTVQAVRVVMAWLIGSGLGIDAPLAYYFVVMPVGIVLILLPISISGLGPAQGVIIWMLQPLGVADADAFALSTLFILLGFVANLPGALIYLRHRH